MKLSIWCWKPCICSVAHTPIEEVWEVSQICDIILEMGRWLHHPVDVMLLIPSQFLTWWIFPCEWALMEQDSITFMDSISSYQGSVGCKESAGLRYKPSGSKWPTIKFLTICLRTSKNILVIRFGRFFTIWFHRYPSFYPWNILADSDKYDTFFA